MYGPNWIECIQHSLSIVLLFAGNAKKSIPPASATIQNAPSKKKPTTTTQKNK
tara:strand:+ start:2301 stop:2459 length:159 start_codon:yes stop_codon:yes gene_type:complete